VYGSRFNRSNCLAVYARRGLEIDVLSTAALSSDPEGEAFLKEFQIALIP
jgi:hypothetical protein